jgi:hypothetical protein
MAASDLILFILEAGYLKAGVLVLVVDGRVRLAKILGRLPPLDQRHNGAD